MRRCNEKVVPRTVHHTGGAEVDSTLGGATEECSDLWQPGEGPSRRMEWRIGAGRRRRAAPRHEQHRHCETPQDQQPALHPAEPDPAFKCRPISVITFTGHTCGLVLPVPRIARDVPASTPKVATEDRCVRRVRVNTRPVAIRSRGPGRARHTSDWRRKPPPCRETVGSAPRTGPGSPAEPG